SRPAPRAADRALGSGARRLGRDPDARRQGQGARAAAFAIGPAPAPRRPGTAEAGRRQRRPARAAEDRHARRLERTREGALPGAGRGLGLQSTRSSGVTTAPPALDTAVGGGRSIRFSAATSPMAASTRYTGPNRPNTRGTHM